MYLPFRYLEKRTDETAWQGIFVRGLNSDRVYQVHVPDQCGSLTSSRSYEPPRGVKTSKYRVRRGGGLHGGVVLHREGVYV